MKESNQAKVQRVTTIDFSLGFNPYSIDSKATQGQIYLFDDNKGNVEQLPMDSAPIDSMGQSGIDFDGDDDCCLDNCCIVS